LLDPSIAVPAGLRAIHMYNIEDLLAWQRRTLRKTRHHVELTESCISAYVSLLASFRWAKHHERAGVCRAVSSVDMRPSSQVSVSTEASALASDRFRLLVPLLAAVSTLRVWMERHVQMIALADESPSSLVGRAMVGCLSTGGAAEVWGCYCGAGRVNGGVEGGGVSGGWRCSW